MTRVIKQSSCYSIVSFFLFFSSLTAIYFFIILSQQLTRLVQTAIGLKFIGSRQLIDHHKNCVGRFVKKLIILMPYRQVIQTIILQLRPREKTVITNLRLRGQGAGYSNMEVFKGNFSLSGRQAIAILFSSLDYIKQRSTKDISVKNLGPLSAK